MKVLGSAITAPLEKLYDKVLVFLPNVLAFISICIVGIIAAWILKKAFLRFFNYIKLDRIAERTGIAQVFTKSGITDSLSALLSRIFGWLTVIVFLVIALQALDVPAVEKLLTQLLLYVPHMFIAAFMLLLGYLLGTFFGRAALIASVNAGIKIAGLIGRFVKFTVFVLSATMALEQLGIGRETVLIAFAITFGGVVLAFAIAFGLGGKDLARDILEKKVRDEKPPDDISHL
jgi:small-conductance mechanosensitive channel